jgi:hypothetical protein
MTALLHKQLKQHAHDALEVPALDAELELLADETPAANAEAFKRSSNSSANKSKSSNFVTSAPVSVLDFLLLDFMMLRALLNHCAGAQTAKAAST